MSLFTFAFLNERIKFRNKRYEKELGELQRVEKELLELYDEMISKTKKKYHFVVRGKVLGKDKTYQGDHCKYDIRVKILEDGAVNGVVIVPEGATCKLRTQYDYVNCYEGGYVDVHYYLRVGEGGKLIMPIVIKGEPHGATLEDCSERFLSTP